MSAVCGFQAGAGDVRLWLLAAGQVQGAGSPRPLASSRERLWPSAKVSTKVSGGVSPLDRFLFSQNGVV